MKGGQGLSDVVRASISPSLSAKSRRETHFRKNSQIWMGRTFLGSTSCRGSLRFRHRADLLVVIELLRCRVLLLLQERQLHIEQEAALFRQVACRPLDCQNVKSSKQASSLSSSCEGDNGVQIFLPFASGTRSLTWSSEAMPVLFRPSSPIRAASAHSRCWGEFQCSSSVE